MTPLSVLEFRIVQRVLTWTAPTASIHRQGYASVFGPNDADRRGAPVPWDTSFLRMNHCSLKLTTITQAHHPRVLHDGQDQRAARIFRDLRNRSPGA